ncbi:hypothetical protein FRC02_011522 [Tulasnella sp. 418]|nr:hypothetical protein FRC02_011522 [Tulasnella sp. 418]
MGSRNTLWDTGHDEEVQVDQRALIDKVLARYSGEFTVFRELLQNADDAAARTVEIHFNTEAYLAKVESGIQPPETEPSFSPSTLPNLKTQPLAQWSFRNDGMPFRDEDWNRLTKIAVGNPDERKIGAFGVGFYSLFSVTDEPFVQSGQKWMGFYWKDNKDQLYTRRGDLSSPPSIGPSGAPWTSFDMPLREASPLPGLPADIARFLATSLTFMTNLRDVSMFFDDHRLARIQKDVGVSKSLIMPSNLKTKSPQGIMEVKAVDSSDLHVTAKVMRCVYQTGTEKEGVPAKSSRSSGGFFSSLLGSLSTHTLSRTPEPQPPTKEPEPFEALESSVLLKVYSAQVDVKLDKQMSTELERATKKKPPTTCSLSLIYTGKYEFDASEPEDEWQFKDSEGVFQGLRADLDGKGTAKVFIGHATSQSTGIGGHISTRFIPTVERESIDLVDRNVSQWNKELLYVGGFLARLVYEVQMSDIREAWNQVEKGLGPNNAMDETAIVGLESTSTHALRFFSFYPTTPSSVVGSQMEASFFSCAQDQSVPIISTKGIRSASEVRYYHPTFQSFMKNLPMLPKSVADGALAMVAALRRKGMLPDVSFKDVIGELSQRTLTEEEMVECLKWRINLDTGGIKERDKELVRKQFLDSAVFFVPNDERFKEERTIRLASIETFVSPKNVIPATLPLPPHTLPLSVSKNFTPDSLRSFFGWRDLDVVEWVEYLIAPATLETLPEDENMTISAEFSEQVLNIVAKMWSSISTARQTQMITLLRDKTVIPTRSGLKTPGESYFSNANVFQDLPIVAFLSGTAIKGSIEKFLTSLGVMKHVDIHIVLDRFVNCLPPHYSTVYSLKLVFRMINTGDWGVEDLMKYLVAVKTSLKPTELEKLRHTAAFPQEREPNTDSSSPQMRTTPSELYEPSNVFRVLQLPVLDWGTQRWKSKSEEAKILFDLGLRRYPDLPVIIGLMASPDPKIRRTALKYFLDEFYTRYSRSYNPSDFLHLAYIPAVKPDGTHFLARHNEVFMDPECAVMGFSLAKQGLRNVVCTKLRLQMDPPTCSIMDILLASPPADPETARKCFEYLTSRMAEFSSAEIDRLREAPIVPTTPSETGSSDIVQELIMARPRECFFKCDRELSSSRIYAKLFTFVDFGATANHFLRVCGVKDQPSIQDVATLLVEDPKGFLELAGSHTVYLEQLRTIAAYGNYTSDLISQMRASPFLLGYRRTPRSTEETSASGNEPNEKDDCDLTFDLLKPTEVAIVDDSIAYSLFSGSIYAAPEEDILEAFYQKLGSPRITSLVKEEYQPLEIEECESKSAAETRNLIIERFPLLLHNRNTRASVRPVWLSQDDNFTVRNCQKIELKRTLTILGESISKTQEVSATAIFTGTGETSRARLYLSEDDQLDMFEVANSMCKFLLKNPHPQDSLLFMTILSTDLQALGRRGYPVHRILHQHKVESEHRAARRAEGAKGRRQLVEASPSSGATPARVTPYNPPKIRSSSGSGLSGLLKSIKNQIDKVSIRFTDRRLVAMSQTLPENIDGGVTPWSNIEHNIQMAIDDCHPESEHLLEIRQRMTMVNESLEGGYCDISGCDKNFHAMPGVISGYQIFIAHGILSNSSVFPDQVPDSVKICLPDGLDVPSPHDILQQKQAAIQRFASFVMDPLRSLFQLMPASLHIFYDQSGDLIAFNRKGSLFLNLRFYEGWHDIDVSEGRSEKALISWYFILAHEIAHNLVQLHNAKHELYFSAICEKYLLEFFKHLHKCQFQQLEL